MELPANQLIGPAEQDIIGSFKHHVETKNVTEVERYLKDIINPTMLESCLKDNNINVNRLVGTNDKRDHWWQIALRANNKQNFEVITRHFNRCAIQSALGQAIIQNKPEYVAVCLSAPRLIKPLNIDHQTDYGKKIIQNIVDNSTGELARLVVPYTKPHFAIALSRSYFDLIAKKGPNNMYQELIVVCWQQAKKANILSQDLGFLLNSMFTEYINLKEQLVANQATKTIIPRSSHLDSDEWEDL